ncbi:hypothetical protein R5R35_011782 [Gryllus longicercus]|uniref:Accessory gland protein n=1 Tax=Gryllus longicercus TaxID=2509291 RepID=A0AAN9Z666_9ORTH
MRAFFFSDIVLCWVMTLTAFVATGLRSSGFVINQRKSVGKNCSLYEHPCVINGQLPHENGKCYTPLESGPCPKGQVVILDSETSSKELQGRCQMKQCPLGLVPLKGHCLTTTLARKWLCANGPLHLDPMGNPRCGEFSGWKSALLAYVHCTPTKHDVPTPFSKRVSRTIVTVIRPKNVLCAVEDTNQNCTKSVYGISPNALIVPEK